MALYARFIGSLLILAVTGVGLGNPPRSPYWPTTEPAACVNCIITSGSLRDGFNSRRVCEQPTVSIFSKHIEYHAGGDLCLVSCLTSFETISQPSLWHDASICTMDAHGASSDASGHGQETFAEKNAKHFK